MKNVLFLSLLLCSGLVYSQIPETIVSPAQAGAYLPGIMGVRDYANPGQDGLFIIDYNIFLDANTYYNGNGKKVDAIQGPSGNTTPLVIG
jgi:hypothetical protein